MHNSFNPSLILSCGILARTKAVPTRYTKDPDVTVSTFFFTARKRSKVIFSEACVKNSVHGVGGGRLVPAPGRGAWLGEGGLGPGGAWSRHPRTATAAGGTHPTGMHSCLFHKFKTSHVLNNF